MTATVVSRVAQQLTSPAHSSNGAPVMVTNTVNGPDSVRRPADNGPPPSSPRRGLPRIGLAALVVAGLGGAAWYPPAHEQPEETQLVLQGNILYACHLRSVITHLELGWAAMRLCVAVTRTDPGNLEPAGGDSA
jgi:hypothetical protein